MRYRVCRDNCSDQKPGDLMQGPSDWGQRWEQGRHQKTHIVRLHTDNTSLHTRKWGREKLSHFQGFPQPTCAVNQWSFTTGTLTGKHWHLCWTSALESVPDNYEAAVSPGFLGMLLTNPLTLHTILRSVPPGSKKRSLLQFPEHKQLRRHKTFPAARTCRSCQPYFKLPKWKQINLVIWPLYSLALNVLLPSFSGTQEWLGVLWCNSLPSKTWSRADSKSSMTDSQYHNAQSPQATSNISSPEKTQDSWDRHLTESQHVFNKGVEMIPGIEGIPSELWQERRLLQLTGWHIFLLQLSNFSFPVFDPCRHLLLIPHQPFQPQDLLSLLYYCCLHWLVKFVLL